MGNSEQGVDQRLHQAEVLLDISRKVAAIETLDEVLKTLVEITTSEIGAEAGERRRKYILPRIAVLDTLSLFVLCQVSV